MYPDRIVLGGSDDRSLAALREMYSVFEGVDQLETNCKTAEMIKYTANSLLATMISFANEIGNLCAAVGGVDVTEVTKGVHLDKRLTPILPSGERIIPTFTTYIEAGCGFGGSCFPKDVKALNAYGAKKGMPMQLLNAVIDVNAVQYKQVMSRLYKHFPSLDAVRVAVLGLAFKPGTDDMRESPAIPIVQELLAGSAKVKAYDPVAMETAAAEISDFVACTDAYDAATGADAVMLMTPWNEFKQLDMKRIREAMKTPILIDGKNIYDPEVMRAFGFDYRAIGRGYDGRGVATFFRQPLYVLLWYPQSVLDSLYPIENHKTIALKPSSSTVHG